MTNAEKYLKDGVSAYCFWNDFIDYIDTKKIGWNADNFEEFLNAQCKPTLTEDERVILRNINKKFNRIERNKFGFLILTENGCENVGEAMHTLYAFNHLFQFIKNGEEYSIEELLNGDKK